MNTDAPSPTITVAAEWPRATERAGRGLSVSLELTRRQGGAARIGTPPSLLQEASDVLGDMLESPLRDKWEVCVDVAGDYQGIEAWPQWCSTTDQWYASLKRLALAAGRQAKGPGAVYPITIWVVRPNAHATRDLVERHLAHPRNDEIMDALMNAGAVYIGLAPSYGDILAGTEAAEEVLGWFDDLRHEGRVVWEVEKYDI